MVRQHLRPIDIARVVGVSAGAVRYYGWMGFLPPAERSRGGHHRYTRQHLHAALAAHALTRVFGWLAALPVMQLVHGGEVDKALELVDARHAAIDRGRRQIEAALAAMRPLLAQRPDLEGVSRRRGTVRVGEAAKRIGVRPTTLHYWEQLGLLAPAREASSGYRVYDADQLRRLEIIAVLRHGGYTFEDLRAVLDELAAGTPEKALAAMEDRKLGLVEESRLCARATARLWEYIERYCPDRITPLTGTPARYWRVRERRREAHESGSN